MSDATRLVLVRHGETDWNRSGRIQGHTDIALNATGRWQAAQAAAALHDQGLDAIVSSDLSRARETAEAIAVACCLTVALDVGLRERSFGIHEGSTYAEVLAANPAQARHWQQRDPDFEPAGGESLRRFHARAVAATRRLAAAHRGQQIALVAHGGVLDALYRAATGLPPEAPRQWNLDNASIHRLLDTGDALVLLHWGDITHLEANPARDDSSVDPGLTAPKA
jgi:2,3-bisphosphoglycerate-dependent phosphoglycerate mutase